MVVKEIISWCEVKQEGIWRSNQEKVFPNPFYVENRVAKTGNKADTLGKDLSENPLENFPCVLNDLDWFIVLANIKQGFRLGSPIKAISDPRGIPSDAALYWRKIHESWGKDLHYQSWLTIEDFLGVDWNAQIPKQGIITVEQFKNLVREAQLPKTWLDDVWKLGEIVLNQEDALRIIAGEKIKVHPYNQTTVNGFKPKDLVEISEESHPNFKVKASWGIPYSIKFEEQIHNVIEPMKQLREKNEGVRLVFGFY